MPTPTAGVPRAAASARAVAIPIRRPVNEPGPVPTAILPTRGHPPAASATRSIAGSRAAAWTGRVPAGPGPITASSTTSPSSEAQTAVSSVAVSKPTTSIGAPVPQHPGAAQREGSTRNFLRPIRFPFTNQVTLCTPGTFELMML